MISTTPLSIQKGLPIGVSMGSGFFAGFGLCFFPVPAGAGGSGCGAGILTVLGCTLTHRDFESLTGASFKPVC
ncbi:hypothetical protein WJ02_09975 [Burkholderia vietnamiensis]|nr:hypothetical protein WJ02_09975 [Burkholderia vietnamiensis]